jgi:hypothetical protein
MEIAYMLLLAPAVVWVAVMAIELFLHFNDPLRRFYAPRQRHQSVRFRRAAFSRAPRLIKKTAPRAAPLPYRDLPSRPINIHGRMVAIKADFDRAVGHAGMISRGE